MDNKGIVLSGFVDSSIKNTRGILNGKRFGGIELRTIVCSDCGAELECDMACCQKCGSHNRTVKVEIEEHIQIKENIQIKEKMPGKKKPTKESMYSDDKSKATNKWMHKKRIIDRENDRYLEIVSDPHTGEVIHLCEEKLSEHTEHGSAKNRRNINR